MGAKLGRFRHLFSRLGLLPKKPEKVPYNGFICRLWLVVFVSVACYSNSHYSSRKPTYLRLKYFHFLTIGNGTKTSYSNELLYLSKKEKIFVSLRIVLLYQNKWKKGTAIFLQSLSNCAVCAICQVRQMALIRN